VPKRVPVGEVVSGEVVKLAPERKSLTNLIKMVAYQAESDLVRLVAPHYKRVEDEGRTLIQSALAGPADLEVTDTELRVVLAPLSSPHRTRAPSPRSAKSSTATKPASPGPGSASATGSPALVDAQKRTVLEGVMSGVLESSSSGGAVGSSALC
jgi:hypothetical protein